jgi:ABC-type transport system involved in multi-copper enzyme maturation permease subunit
MGIQLWAILKDGLRESLDRKMFWVLAMITLLTVVVMACISFEPGKIVLLFGTWRIPAEGFDGTTDVGKAMVLSVVIQGVMSLVLGWLGVLLMIVATADFFPAMMERGAIDVVLSKPIPRWKLFLFKYLGSLTFVLMQASLFIVLTFLVMWLRWGIWTPGYLMCIPLLVLLFSYLYCISVYVGVNTRSTVAAILLSVVAWAVFAAPAIARDIVETTPDLRKNEALLSAVRVAAWIPPKTGDVDYIASQWAKAGSVAELMPVDGSEVNAQQMEEAKQYEGRRMKLSAAQSIGSSLLFEAIVLGLAMWRFCRRDF